MKACLNQAGPPPTWACPYETEAFVEAAAEAGFEGIELRLPNLENYMRKKSMQDLVDFLNTYNLDVVAMNHVDSPAFLPEKAFMEFLDDFRGKMEICSELSCDKIVVGTSRLPSLDIKPEKIVEKCSTSLRKLANLGAEYGVTIALEVLAREIENERVYKFAIDTPKKYKDVLKTIGVENIGLTLDTFHFYIGRMIDEIKTLPNILIVHVSDAEKSVPFEKLKDHPHRVFPGEGVMDLDSIIRALKTAGYDGYLSVEVFHPPYWELTPIEFAMKARKSLDRLLEITRDL